MEIITDPNPILHQKTKKIKLFDKNLDNFVKEMAKTLFENNGVGLAAPQVNKPIRLSVIEYNPKRFFSEEELKTIKDKTIPLMAIVNPKITWHSREKMTNFEGCLSLPHIELPVERAQKVHVLAQDVNEKKIKIRAEGLAAQIFQHEIDHLDGILITDRSKVKINKIIFIGTPEFSVPIIERLSKSPFKPYLVITEPDKPYGRNKTLTPPPIKIFAEQKQIEVWQSTKIEKLKLKIENLKPDLIIVAAYGQIIPKEILDSARYGAINVHPSLLPKYRGASPIQYALLNGEKKTGITIMKMDEKMDHGPILAQKYISIDANDNYQTLSEKISRITGDFLVNTIAKYISKRIRPKPQNHEKATFTKLIKKEDGKIDWKLKPAQINNQVKAFYPWPGAYTEIDGKRLKICQTHLHDDKLIIDRVQIEGKKEISFDEFQRGWKKNIDFLKKIR